MVNAQEWLNEKYPVSRRNEITELDISKGKVKKWLIHDSTLKGDLILKDFTNLQTLNCSGHELTNLDVSGCQYLIDLDCQNNRLNSLNISGCSNLEKLNCDFNKSLKKIDISDCPNLNETGLGFAIENEKLVKNVPQIIPAEGNSVRNILIIGITGSGKSALANALTDTEQFRESSSSSSITKSFKESDIFEWKGKKYRVIDNIGFGDTNNMSEEEILLKIGEGIHSSKEGLNQILFIFKDRFSPEHVKVFNMFKDFVDEAGIARFITVIRTNFGNFQEEDKCEEDKNALLSQSPELREIIGSCNNVIHVDNPEIPIIKEKDKGRVRERKEERIRANKELRKDSREKVLDHLAENCQKIYKLKKWDNIVSMVDNYYEAEKNSSLTKEKKLGLRTEVVQGLRKEIEASVGVSVPQIGVSANAAFKYKIQN